MLLEFSPPKQPTAIIKLVVKDLVQRFRTSGKETISWFVAEGELVEIKNVPSTTERVSV